MIFDANDLKNSFILDFSKGRVVLYITYYALKIQHKIVYFECIIMKQKIKLLTGGKG